jgi:hypothetical protein
MRVIHDTYRAACLADARAAALQAIETHYEDAYCATEFSVCREGDDVVIRVTYKREAEGV